MDLYDYFYKMKKEKGLEVRDLAKMLGVNASYMSCLLNARRYPGFSLAEKIEKVTNGEVKALDLMMARYQRKTIPINISKSRCRKKKEAGEFSGEQLSLNL